MAKITIKDVAVAANVGVATVDRVLNKRAAVSPATARRVLEAAEELGYHARGLLRSRLEDMAPAIRLGIVLQKRSKCFYQELDGELRSFAEQATRARLSIEVVYVNALEHPHLTGPA